VPTRVERRGVGAAIDVVSDPPGAEVMLGGRLRGRTPLRLSGLGLGSYPLEVRKEGYLPYAQPVRLEQEGATYAFRVTLAPAASASSFVSVTSQPPGAAVKLDGKPAGVTPLKLGPLEPGRHELTIEYQGFPAQTRTLDLEAGSLHELKARFETR
jgi:PEGA domain-containing protein